MQPIEIYIINQTIIQSVGSTVDWLRLTGEDTESDGRREERLKEGGTRRRRRERETERDRQTDGTDRDTQIDRKFDTLILYCLRQSITMG